MHDPTPEAGAAPTPHPAPTRAELDLWARLVATKMQHAAFVRVACEQSAETVEALRNLTDLSPRAAAFVAALRAEEG